MDRHFIARLGFVVFATAWTLSWAQEALDPLAEELIEKEKLRSAVETALDNYLAARGPARLDVAVDGIKSLMPFGEDAVPLLANELEQERNDTFDFTAYALGRIDAPGAVEALRRAVERAEATAGNAAMTRKAWACWALGLQGDLDAVDLVNDGRHRAAHFPIHSRTSVLEAVAVQTAPECVPRLLAQLDRWAASEDLRDDRRYAIRSLRRVADPAAVPKLAQILREDEDLRVRGEAALALRSIETPESINALLTTLSDPETVIRRAAAFALEWMRPTVETTTLLEHLDTEQDADTRGALYELIAGQGDAAEVRALLAHFGAADPQDRRMLIEAVGSVGGDEVSKTLVESLDDPSNAVAIAAIGFLAQSRDKNGIDRMLEVLAESTNWTRVQVIGAAAAAQEMRRFAPIMVRRLLELSLLDATREHAVRGTVDALSDGLVTLRYTSGISKLRKARDDIQDPGIRLVFDATIARLELLRANGKDASKWAALTEDPRQAVRRLTYGRLAELGGEQAATALVAAFDSADPADRLAILHALVGLDTPQTVELVRRLLLDDEFDRLGSIAQRDAAAWIARSRGDAEMLALLEESVRRRDGRDAKVLVYALALGGEDALTLLEDYRLLRMKYLLRTRGKEQEALDWIARKLKQGRSIERYDRPPAELGFN